MSTQSSMWLQFFYFWNFPFYLKFFSNYGRHSTLLCIHLKCTAWWSDNHILLKALSLTPPTPNWHHSALLQHYWPDCTIFKQNILSKSIFWLSFLLLLSYSCPHFPPLLSAKIKIFFLKLAMLILSF